MPAQLPGDSRYHARVDQLFRLSGAVRRHAGVAPWFADEPAPLRRLARTWFKVMRSRGPDVRELIHDGCPVVCIDDAPFAYVDAFTRHVNVGFFQGASLPDPARLLQGSGKRMRHVTLRPGDDVDADALTRLITAAYDDIRGRVRRSATTA